VNPPYADFVELIYQTASRRHDGLCVTAM